MTILKHFIVTNVQKVFVSKWRLNKHMKVHTKECVKFSHYYNNDKLCPFDEHGCKFLHKVSQNCELGKRCKNWHIGCFYVYSCKTVASTVSAPHVSCGKKDTVRGIGNFLVQVWTNWYKDWIYVYICKTVPSTVCAP